MIRVMRDVKKGEITVQMTDDFAKVLASSLPKCPDKPAFALFTGLQDAINNNGKAMLPTLIRQGFLTDNPTGQAAEAVQLLKELNELEKEYQGKQTETKET